MTGRQYLDKRVSFLAVITTACLALWLYLLIAADSREDMLRAMATPAGGLLFGWLYHLFMIRCPHCGKSIGFMTRSLSEFSLFRFSKRVRFCPRCTIDFQDEVKSRRGARCGGVTPMRH
jgi:hypothetical protein